MCNKAIRFLSCTLIYAAGSMYRVNIIISFVLLFFGIMLMDSLITEGKEE